MKRRERVPMVAWGDGIERTGSGGIYRERRQFSRGRLLVGKGGVASCSLRRRADMAPTPTKPTDFRAYCALLDLVGGVIIESGWSHTTAHQGRDQCTPFTSDLMYRFLVRGGGFRGTSATAVAGIVWLLDEGASGCRGCQSANEPKQGVRGC